MRIIIIGAGEVGLHLAMQLSGEQNDVILIDSDENKVSKASNILDCLVIHGEGTDMQALINENIKRADIFIAATTLDEINLVSCFMASKSLNVRLKIARVKNLSYMKRGLVDSNSMGIDLLVNPDVEAANDIVQTVSFGASSSIYSFEGTQAQLRSVNISEDSILNNVTLMNIKKILPFDFTIAAISRNDELTVPHGTFTIQANDIVHFVAIGKTFNKLSKAMNINVRSLKRIVVVGATLIGTYVIDMLLDDGKDVRLIEMDPDKCVEMASRFPDLLVINGDISDQELFEEENLKYADAIITTTQNEELNILAGIYAKNKGVKRAVALITSPTYNVLATNLGIDACVNSKASITDAILKFIRKGNVKNVYTIFEGEAEAIEYSIASSSKLIGKQIKDLSLPLGALIIAIQRGRKTIIPTGLTYIEENDSVLVFTNISIIEEIGKIFTSKATIKEDIANLEESVAKVSDNVNSKITSNINTLKEEGKERIEEGKYKLEEGKEVLEEGKSKIENVKNKIKEEWEID